MSYWGKVGGYLGRQIPAYLVIGPLILYLLSIIYVVSARGKERRLRKDRTKSQKMLSKISTENAEIMVSSFPYV